MNGIKEILRNDLCLGCGLCEAVSATSRMTLTQRGFYRPQPVPTDKQEVDKIKSLCPGIKVVSERASNTTAWGSIESVSNAWAVDKNIRLSSSSGGVTSALAIYLLETGKVDAVLHVGNEEVDYLHNRLQVSRSRQEILTRNSSRYAPALMFDRLFELLDAYPKEKFCFIGKPCDVAAIRNVIREYPQYKQRFLYCLAIFCAGMPSYNATLKAISTFGNDGEPVSLRYRGDGWPGYFTVEYADQTRFRMSYNDSWGKILGRDLGFRCKVCPDGIGLLADVSSGDSWNTQDGYPDFTESEGRNFCFIRTKEGSELFEGAKKAGYIETEEIDVTQVRYIQRYQFNRRHVVGWRIAVVQILTGNIFKFKNLGYTKLALRTNYLRAFRDACGTYKRMLKIRRVRSM